MKPYKFINPTNGEEYVVIDKKNGWSLLVATNPKNYNQYVVVNGLTQDGAWASGEYFKTLSAAQTAYRKHKERGI